MFAPFFLFFGILHYLLVRVSVKHLGHFSVRVMGKDAFSPSALISQLGLNRGMFGAVYLQFASVGFRIS
jgi:hypothetical protein